MRTNLSGEGLFWCALFFALGPALIILNNYVLNKINYQYPILFSSLGVWGTAIVCHILKLMGQIEIRKRLSFDFWLIKILPLGLLSAATIATGNSVFLFISVSFTQMLKALTPLYIIFCLVCFNVERPRRRVVLAVLLITVGTIFASFGELRFSWYGFILQSLADLFEGSRLVLMQMLLVNNGLDPIESIYYIFPATGISQLLMILLYERSALTEPASWFLVTRYWYLFFLAMALGIAVNLVGIFVIKHTSGLMLKLIGVVRNNFIVLLSVLFLGEKTTSIQIFGYILSIAGFVWYANLTHTAKHVDEKRPYKELDDL